MFTHWKILTVKRSIMEPSGSYTALVSVKDRITPAIPRISSTTCYMQRPLAQCDQNSKYNRRRWRTCCRWGMVERHIKGTEESPEHAKHCAKPCAKKSEKWNPLDLGRLRVHCLDNALEFLSDRHGSDWAILGHDASMRPKK